MHIVPIKYLYFYFNDILWLLAMLISITIMVIISQQYFLYIPAIFIPMNAKSIPTPTRHPPQISILISQYIIPAMTGLDIPSLICATFFPISATT